MSSFTNRFLADPKTVAVRIYPLHCRPGRGLSRHASIPGRGMSVQVHFVVVFLVSR